MDALFMFHTIDPVLSLRFQPVSGLHFKLFKIHYILLGKTVMRWSTITLGVTVIWIHQVVFLIKRL